MKKHLFYFVTLFLVALLAQCHHTPMEELIKEPDTPTPPAADPLTAVSGRYEGLQTCNGSGLTASIWVSKHSTKNNYLKIGDDEVFIDTSCMCQPNPSIGNYRIYSARFRNDSLLLYTEIGPLNQPDWCRYSLKKQ